MNDKSHTLQKTQRDILRYAANLIGAAAAIYILVTTLFRLLLGWLFTAFNKSATLANPVSVPDIAVALGNLLLTGIGLVCAIWFLSRSATASLRPRLHFTDPKDVRLWLFLPVFLGIGILCSVLTAGLQSWLAQHTAYTVPEGTRLPNGVLPMLLAFLTLCVAPAILEEILCRGWMQGMLRRWGVWFSVIVSSAVFALLHGDIAQMPSILILSVCLGLAAYATDSLLPSVLLHFCNNTVAFIMLCTRQKLSGTAQLGASLYFVFIVFAVTAAAVALIIRWRLLSTLRPVPVHHNPENRQKRVLRMATAPVYVVVMLWLVLRAVWPLFPLGKGA